MIRISGIFRILSKSCQGNAVLCEYSFRVSPFFCPFVLRSFKSHLQQLPNNSLFRNTLGLGLVVFDDTMP